MSIFSIFKNRNIKSPDIVTDKEKKMMTFMIREDMFSWDKVVEFSKYSNPEFYEKVKTIYRCVRMIAKNGATLPIGLMERGITKDRDVEVFGHPTLNILYGKANEIQSGTSFLMFYTSSYLLTGNGYARLVGTVDRPLALNPLFPQNVTPSESKTEDAPIEYKYMTPKGTEITIPFDEMWHTMDYNPYSLLKGLSPVSVARLTAEMQYNSEQWNCNMIKKGGKIPFIVKVKGDLTDTQFKKAEARIRQGWEGAKNVGKIQLMDGDASIEKIGMTPVDMDWINTQKLTTREIANIYGVDSSLLNDPEAKTFANRADARKALYTETIFPVMKEILDSLGFFLFYDPKLGRTTHYFKIKRDDVEAIQTELKDKIESVSKAWYFTPDEMREECGKERLNTPAMKKIYKPMNLEDIEMLGGDFPE